MKVLIAHPGTQYSHQLVRQLYNRGLLLEFHTCIAFGEDTLVYKVCSRLPLFIFNRLKNRFIADIPDSLIRRQAYIELLTLLKLKLGFGPEAVYYKRNKHFQKNISRNKISEADVVIAFDTSAWILAELCTAMKKMFILDVSIGHPVEKEKIYNNLLIRYPDWKEQVLPKNEHYIKDEAAEMQLADLIVVPGNFVKSTLVTNNIAGDKIRINNFGTDIWDYGSIQRKAKASDKISFLFMGSFSVRKGLPLLLDVWRDINSEAAELIIAGYGNLPDGIELPVNVKNIGAVSKDNRAIVFSNSDVFIFPSFFEGLAQVQIEAMASGLPLIGTINSGAEDLITDGVEGFIIKQNDDAILKEKILFFINNPDRISEMGELAKQKAKNFTWQSYGDRWAQILKSSLINSN